MAKFNVPTTRNREGHIAFRMSPKEKLVTEVLTSFFNEGKFYGDNSKEIIDDIKTMIDIDATFVANLAIYARKEMHLRSISHVCIGELAHNVKGKKFVRAAINEIVERVDDMSEILSYYLNTYGKPIPNSLKKGLADKFITFSEYSLAKYNKSGDVKLKDIINLTHPKPKSNEQSNLLKKVLEDELMVPETWETMLSKEGNNEETWTKLIDNKSLGYMAMLRNLRNIIKSNPSNIDKVYEALQDEERVKRSKQLPFRYFSAFRVLQMEGLSTSKNLQVLENAIKHSTKNIETLKGKTFIATDMSGSMSYRLSAKSNVTCAETGAVLMAIANSICDEAITSTFDNYFYLAPMPKENGIISNALSIEPNYGGTDLSLPLKYLIEEKIYVDRIIILSDNEINTGYSGVCQRLVDIYRKEVNPNVYVHAIDLLGYGTQQFMGEKVNIIAGWNEKILEFIPNVEKGMGKIVDVINNYYFKKNLN